MALLEAQQKQFAQTPITNEGARQVLSTGQWSDEDALRLVIQDANIAENFEATKQWVMNWPTATVLYQSPFTSRYWEGTQTEKSNIPFYTVATVINSLVPQIMKGLFYEDPPFQVTARPGTHTQVARADKEIIAYQLNDINFRQELRYGVVNALLYGTGIWKYGFETYTRFRKIYKRKTSGLTVSNPPFKDIQLQSDDDDEIEEQIVEEYIDRPFFNHLQNLRYLLVDPKLNVPNVQKAAFVVERNYLTWEGLDRLRDRPGMKLPTKEKLLELFLPPKEPVEAATAEQSIRNPLWDARAAARYEETTIDPFQQPLEVLTRWDNDKMIMVLQKKLVICNDANPYGKIPFLSVGWWDVPEAFWSMGLGKTVGAEQRLQQGIMNTWLDGVSLNLNGVYKRKKGKSVPTQSIRISPGKIVEVDDMDDFEPLDRLPAVPEALAALQQSQMRAETVSGASELVIQGTLGGGGRSSITRTAAGVNAFTGGSTDRIGDWVEKLCDQVIIPLLYEIHEMNRTMLPASTIRYILDDELEHDYEQYKGDFLMDILNSRVKFNITAGARMQSRKVMAQAFPIFEQILTNQQVIQSLQVEGKKVAFDEFLHLGYELAEFKNYRDVIVPMTPQDQQRMMAMNPGVQKAAAASQLQNQKFQQQQVMLDNENYGRAAREILRTAVEKSAGPEAVSGEPTGTGFGS